MHWQPDSSSLRALLDALAREISPVYVVGGVVRDLLLRRLPSTGAKLADIDLAVAHSAIPISRRVADRLGWAFYALDEGRDVARLIFNAGAQPLVCDIARLRGGSIESDLRARDFTINALAFAWQGGPIELIDPGAGYADLQARRLRRVSHAALAEDPVRLLRAARFSVELGFPIEEETRLQILRLANTAQLAGPERQRDELWKMLAGQNPAAAVDLLRTLGLLPWTLPEVAAADLVTQSAPHDKDVYRHTLAAVQIATALRDWLLGRRARVPLPTAYTEARTEPLLAAQRHLETWSYYLRRHFAPALSAGRTRADWLVWHALLHDVGKPETRTLEPDGDGGVRIRFFGHEEAGERMAQARLTALRFSRSEVELCAAVVRGHMRPHHLHDAFPAAEISRRARFRFFRDVGIKAVDRPVGVDVLLTAMADRLAIGAEIEAEAWRAYLAHIAQMLSFVYSEQGVETAALRPLVDGHTLMRELGVGPGRALGALLDELAEAQAAGEIATAAEALALARTLVRTGK